MIELRDNTLHFSFPDLHPKARCALSFQRTLRIPDDNQDYPLPAGLGTFPVWPVDDFPVPAQWREHGGVFFPMYQSEAMWIDLDSPGWPQYPFAIKVAAGKINAVTGQPWTNELTEDPQDYLVLPEQPWLDGFNVAEGIVRQFVAARLGEGHTAEEQLTGEGRWGGLQIVAYPMKPAVYRERIELPALQQDDFADDDLGLDVMFSRRVCESDEMGLAPGGRITQEIAEDPYGIDAWDTSHYSRCFVHLLNSDSFQRVTGHQPPTEPISPDRYRAAGVPWFDYYRDGPSLPGSRRLAQLDGMASRLIKQGGQLQNNAPIRVDGAIRIHGNGAPLIREGRF